MKRRDKEAGTRRFTSGCEGEPVVGGPVVDAENDRTREKGSGEPSARTSDIVASMKAVEEG